MELRRLVFGKLFIHLLILTVAHQLSVAKKIEDENWRKMTVDDQVINQASIDRIDRFKFDDNASDISSAYLIPEDTNVLQLHSTDIRGEIDRKAIHVKTHAHQHIHSHSSSHLDHMDPSVIVFFILDDLKLGKTMLIYFPDRVLSSYHFLPREEAAVIPFSSKELPYLFHLFSFPQGSPQAIAMEDTVRECEMEPIKGEIKLCATSIASMLEFAQHIFGSDNEIKILSTVHRTRLTVTFQKYTITEVPEEISASKMVACHTMPYPYGVLYCHYQEMQSRVYKVPLVGKHGDKIEAIAVCHMDTSQWGRNHVSFRVLGIEPGSQPVCHFFPADNLVLIPATSA